MVLFTATLVLVFFLLALLAIAVGHHSDHIELYFFGVVLLLFMGLSTLVNGLPIQSGELILFNETVVGNITSQDRVVTFVYEDNINVWTNGIGLLAVLIAAGLGLTWRDRRRKERVRKEQGLDLEDF